MRILTTALILVVTLLLVPISTYFFGIPLNTTDKEALYTLLYVNLAIILICFIVSSLTKNYSQTDKIWSLAPILYVWIVTYYGAFHTRLVLMSILVTLWGVRLTYNFALKGGYSWKIWAGEEDYRWKVLREKPEFQPRWKWVAFNFFFISGYQNILILFFTLPILIALQFRDVPLNVWDCVATGLFLFFLVYETVADHQHWQFQKEKWRRIHLGDELVSPYDKGFMDQGLWQYSRHPNYFGEQGVWLSFYLFSVAASGLWLNWSITGSLLLVILFQNSSMFGEEISAKKYLLYQTYQKNVPRFIPRFRK